MEYDKNIFRDSSQVIQEVEDELERILKKKFGDVDSDLVERINREKEAARRRKEEIEREFEKERSALTDYRGMVRDFEEQRAKLLAEARDRFEKAVKLQAEIENLAKSTVEEIKRVNDIQDKLEELRSKTSERAAFLKNDLRERFGIVAEVIEDEPKPLRLDLDEELEKLRKIKDLLAIESAAANLGRLGGEAARREDLADMDAAADTAVLDIPEILELIAGPAASEAPAVPAEERPQAAASPSGPESAPEADERLSEEDLAACLETYRRTDPANGSGEIHFFQKDRVVVADPERLLAAVDRTLDEAQRLTLKIGLTESPKDQFFIKQELINWQEGLRAFLLRIIKMCEKNSCVLPLYTREIVNSQVLRGLLERLSMENWSNLEEFASFSAVVGEMRKAFQGRLEPRLPYLRALKREIEAG